MALGPGKYDWLATHTRKTVRASGVILIVMEGTRGSGFSVQASPEVTSRLPEILRHIADDIEKDLTGRTPCGYRNN